MSKATNAALLASEVLLLAQCDRLIAADVARGWSPDEAWGDVVRALAPLTPDQRRYLHAIAPARLAGILKRLATEAAS